MSGGSGTLPFSNFYLNLVLSERCAPPPALPPQAIQAWLGPSIAGATTSRWHSLGLGPTNFCFLSQVYHNLATPTSTVRLAHVPCTHQTTAMPPPHDPNTHVADVEDAERCFHVPATLLEVLGASDDVARTWKCFSVSSTSAKILHAIPPRCATNPINQEAQGVPFLTKAQAAQPPPRDKPPRECTWHHGVVWNG